MSFSNWMENKVLDHIFGKAIYYASTMYIGLCTANPGEGAKGNNCHEVANAYDYARTAAASWYAASGGVISNVGEIVFPIASGSWGTVTHFVLSNYGSYGGGDVIAYGALNTSRSITKYSRPRFDPGELSITLD